jgi:hypothetical protein
MIPRIKIGSGRRFSSTKVRSPGSDLYRLAVSMVPLVLGRNVADIPDMSSVV